MGSNALSRTLGGIDLRSGPKRFEGCRLAHPSVCYPAWEELDKTLTEYHGAERVRRCLKCGVVDVTYPDVGERTADEAAQAYRDRHVSEQVATRIKALEDRVAAAERQVADVVTALVESWLQVQRARQSLASPVEWVVLSVRTADALVAALTERKP